MISKKASNPDINQIIGKILQACRRTRRLLEFQSRGITQADVARSLGVSQSVISKIEAGKLSLGFPEFLLFARAMNMSPQQLLQIIEEVLTASEYGKKSVEQAIQATFLSRVLSDKA